MAAYAFQNETSIASSTYVGWLDSLTTTMSRLASIKICCPLTPFIAQTRCDLPNIHNLLLQRKHGANDNPYYQNTECSE